MTLSGISPWRRNWRPIAGFRSENSKSRTTLARRRLGRRCLHRVPSPPPFDRPARKGRYWLRSSRGPPILQPSRPIWLPSPPFWVPRLRSLPSSTGSNEVAVPSLSSEYSSRICVIFVRFFCVVGMCCDFWVFCVDSVADLWHCGICP